MIARKITDGFESIFFACVANLILSAWFKMIVSLPSFAFRLMDFPFQSWNGVITHDT